MCIKVKILFLRRGSRTTFSINSTWSPSSTRSPLHRHTTLFFTGLFPRFIWSTRSDDSYIGAQHFHIKMSEKRPLSYFLVEVCTCVFPELFKPTEIRNKSQNNGAFHFVFIWSLVAITSVKNRHQRVRKEDGEFKFKASIAPRLLSISASKQLAKASWAKLWSNCGACGIRRSNVIMENWWNSCVLPKRNATCDNRRTIPWEYKGFAGNTFLAMRLCVIDKLHRT